MESVAISKSAQKIFKMIEEFKVEYLDLRFTDTRGKELHVSVPVSAVDDVLFEKGKMFDGSSVPGWKGISDSDMVLKPDINTAVIDPFFKRKTLNLCCDVLEPSTGKGYDRDPRSVAKRAEQYMRDTGIADAFYVGPEPEFFIFDDVRWETGVNAAFYHVDSEVGIWNSGKEYTGGNKGQRAGLKNAYFHLPPLDSSQDIRSDICDILAQMGYKVEAHHPEVATGNQNEICVKYSSIVEKADEMQIFKYVIRNVAKQHDRVATFMPKPLVGDNGNGMHIHQSLAKGGENIFAGDMYEGLSETALFYIGGIIKHARALNAFTNPTTNSYKRLVPGFEAPTIMAYSKRNRSVAIRIPHIDNKKGTRIEARFPDPSCNSYLAFAAMLMAGLDGIQNKIHPGEPVNKDMYEMPQSELDKLPQVCHDLQQALYALKEDREFLTKGGVFSNDFIDSYIRLKNEEVARLRCMPHPAEFDMYFID